MLGSFHITTDTKYLLRGTLWTVNGWWMFMFMRFLILHGGCNKFHTKIKGSFKMVVGYYLALILNQLSEYGADGRKELIPIMRSYLG